MENGLKRYERWWTAKKSEVHTVVTGLVDVLIKRTHSKRQVDIFHAKLYSNHDVAGTGTTSASALELLRGEDGRMRYQLCTSVVDTMHAMLTANKPVPYYLPDGGGWTEQRKAKRKAKLVVGQFMDLDIHRLASQVAYESLTYGTGFLHGYVDDDGLVCVEKVPQCEIVVDVAESAAGHIRAIHRRRMVPKETLAEAYPKLAGKIRMSSGPTAADWADRHLRMDGTIEMVMVTESWRMPSRKGAGDGRRVIATSHATLVDEEWKHEWLPFASMRWKDRLSGWWGCGLIEESKAAQLRCNKLIRRSEKMQNLGTNIWCFLPKGSGIEPHEMTNAPVQVLTYNDTGSPPVIHKQDGTPHDLDKSLKDVRDDLFQQIGISTSMLQGEKPKGITSAVGMVTAEDIGSRRHVSNIRQWEHLFTETTRLLERLNDDAAERAEAKGEVYYVRSVETRGRMEMSTKVAWTDVQTDENTTIKMFPVSALGTTPAGKMESVQQLVKGGYMPMHYALKLLDMPDLDSSMGRLTIDIDIAQYQLEQIMDGSTKVTPLPFQNLPLTYEEARTTRLQAELYEAPRPIKDSLQEYLDTVVEMIKSTEAQASAQMQQQAGLEGQSQMDQQAMLAQAQAAQPAAA